jgi:3-methylcrotonyl-CoA carboxylase alpha subunit
MFNKILIANRGEIACRIIKTCRRLGVRTVSVYSSADAHAQHVLLADEAYFIGGPRPAESYLRGDVIIEAALKSGAQAIHPGYGFLSENADFADAVARAGLCFIGPNASSMRKMGSKAGAKALMSAHHVPVVPGYTEENQEPAYLQQEADRIGYPLMIKAAYGGGGKGMRVVHTADAFLGALESCQREALNAFGKDRVLLERYIENPRHIEMQIFGDHSGHVIHLFERECSAQRRYQKVFEESPSPFLTPTQREAMGKAAIAAGHALNYINAGTVEFIVAPNGDFFFMEINTRLQVEHPITEMVTGLDLVELQLQVASGLALTSRHDLIDLKPNGHAIEVRIYAEDPEQNFLPGSGRLDLLKFPSAKQHIRIDSGVVENDLVSIYYDPMIAKLITWGTDRNQALLRLQQALAETNIAGPKHNIEFLEHLIRHPVVTEARIDTSYLDKHLSEVLPNPKPPTIKWIFSAAALVLLHEEQIATTSASHSSEPQNPWFINDAWRLGHLGKRLVMLSWRDQVFEVSAHGATGCYEMSLNETTCHIDYTHLEENFLHVSIDKEVMRLRYQCNNNFVYLHDGQNRIQFEHLNAFSFTETQNKDHKHLLAPMPGRVVAIKIEPAQIVREGQELLILEAMKMEMTLRAPRDGIIASIQAKVGDFVEADTILIHYAEDATCTP